MNRRGIGVNFNQGGIAEVRLWAPLKEEAAIRIGQHTMLKMDRQPYGYWALSTDQLKPGDRYLFDIDGRLLPDPASLSQPDGVHGPSQAIDLEFGWTDHDWRNPETGAYFVYELHTGTFSGEAGFTGIAERLDHLSALGVTAIEIMPVAQFPGERNWGYDGVFPFAVQHSYGGYAGLQQLVDTCHRKGLAVVLDVVYNHIGPEGNYLSAFAPYFTEKYQTPWGNAINYDDAWCEGTREFFIENALMWFRDFHIDALRLDAVHAIRDFSPRHFLKELRERVNQLSLETGKLHHLIIECDLNDTRYIDPVARDGFGMDAQWTDEFHHALRVTAGQERNGYYSDFTGIRDLAKAYSDAYVYTGQYSAQRARHFGVPAPNSGNQFVVFSQNHDQVGNRMMGERTSMLLSAGMQRLMAAAVIAGPFIPLLFMGEEWSAQTPFLYFVSHTDKELIAAVQKGRREEFKEFHSGGEAPDPQSEDTFRRSKLNWNELQQEPSKQMLDYYKRLIELKKTNPVLKSHDRKNLSVTCNEQQNTLQLLRWDKKTQVLCLMNFSKAPRDMELPEGDWQLIFSSADRRSAALLPESISIYSKNV